MENASTESVASRGTHSTCETEQGSSECVKVSHCVFLDSMPVLPEEVLSHHPDYKGMFCKIPDDEVSAVNLYRLFCKAVMDRKVCPGYILRHCRTKYDSNNEWLCRVDIGLYKPAEAPEDGCSYWDRQRMWLEFRKKGSNSADPFSNEEDEKKD
ncbi:hypothetical protein A0H81_06313 [Grifola frondosa]|uniref:Uncharacterized protein n=1 Tax=Grifola frondosa TaxID=5627 RepID=A0A1C7MAS9_GRIFR|nr:hypothetical protein A0H81_06313 [Grifola frondosa]